MAARQRGSLALVVLALATSANALPPTKPVTVENTVAIDGTVSVDNFPASQVVTGAVEVTNFPNPVPLTCTPARFQLVGFTTTTYTGAMGGNIGVTQKCQLEFPDSRMCSQEEAAATTALPTTALPTLITGTAWIHSHNNRHGSGVLFSAGINTSSTSSCSSWQWGGSNAEGSTVDGSTGDYAASLCDVARPIACCALVP